MIRVLLADDQAMVRAGFRLILSAEPDITVVGEAADGAEAVTAARRLRPDVTLMDVRMPRLDGISATRRLAAEDPPLTRVVVLTTFDVDSHVYDALRAGASGFLLKNAPPEELVAGDPAGGGRRRAARPRRHPPGDRGVRPQPGARPGARRGRPV